MTAKITTQNTQQFDLLALHKSGDKASMTSLDIAELVGSRHSDVKRSIERLTESLIIRKPPVAFLERINNLGFTVQDEAYTFEGEGGKRDSIVVVAQLYPGLTAQLVDRWRELESGEALPHSAQQQSGINPDLIAVARAVAESTAAGVMKSILESTGIQATVNITATVKNAALPATMLEDEFVPIHNVSWDSGLSDATCRRLVTFSCLPNCHIDGVRGLCVHRQAFMAAAQTLLDESERPSGKRKRWRHPEFGSFEVRIRGGAE